MPDSGGMVTSRTHIENADFVGSDGEGMHVLVMSPDSFNTFPLPKLGVVAIGRSGKSKIIVEDRAASRDHALLHIEGADGFLHIEDVGSANGTRVRDAAIEPKKKILIAPGEAITIGTTVLMVQHNRTAMGHQRLWSHAYFETRLEAECSRGDTSGGRFSLCRLRLGMPLTWTKLAPMLAREVPAPNVFAAYGPNDYEILIIEKNEDETAALIARIKIALGELEVPSTTGVATYPRDGRTVDALLARANARLRPGAERDVAKGMAAVIAPLAPVPAHEHGPAMKRLHDMVARTAGATINVLVLGETGVGKEVMSKALHQLSPRLNKPFLGLNCAGLTESLVESELFGHERGAFTGAVGPKQGLLESADGGTVLLDEVGELPMAVQAKLLRVLETREVTRVGAVKAKAIDVRIVSATNRDLEQEVLKGTFRQDLFFRLNGISLAIPPLRERVTEIAALAEQFIATLCAETGREPPVLGDEVLDLLEGYSWPGNIRELKNVMERALVLCDGGELLPEHLPLDKILPNKANEGPTAPTLRRVALPGPLSATELQERERMLDALETWVGNQTKAAAAMGMPRRTFVSKLDRYGIPRPQKGQPNGAAKGAPGAPGAEDTQG
ncbi:MAG: sigma 54-interacting transcriptional regulator [Deltaproteobacteria bacterium]|nr:sigma 54-interacting transcriptional regulator [Deltaproteobacteria bacterium]